MHGGMSVCARQTELYYHQNRTGETEEGAGWKSEKRQHFEELYMYVMKRKRMDGVCAHAFTCSDHAFMTVIILTLSVWEWGWPGWWPNRTERRTELDGQPDCSSVPSWGRGAVGAAEDGSWDGAVAAGDGAGAGAEAGVWAGAGSDRTTHCERESAGMIWSSKPLGSCWTVSKPS